MPLTIANRTVDTRYAVAVIVRSASALAVAVWITFSADHSATFGFLTLGVFAAATAAIMIVSSARYLPPGTTRMVFYSHGVVGIATAIVAILSLQAGLGFLAFLLSGYAAITGFLELYAGIRDRGRVSSARDWLWTGAITALLAVIVLLVPLDFQQQFTGPDGVRRVLTASIIVVGVFGAYCALLGVYLAIAGISLKWPNENQASSETEKGN